MTSCIAYLFLIVWGAQHWKEAQSEVQEPSNYTELMNVKKYTLSTQNYMNTTLNAIALLDAYNTKISKKSSFQGGNKLVAAVFSTLAGLRRSQTTFSQAITSSYSLRRNMDQSLRGINNTVDNIENGGKCSIGGVEYTKKDCDQCLQSIPNFVMKKDARETVKRMINTIRLMIPKQFTYYIRDIYIIIAEGIRIMDKLNTCVQKGIGSKQCDLKEKSFAFFTSQMKDIGNKEESLLKLISAEKAKVAVATTQLTDNVKLSMEAMNSCLSMKKESDLNAEVSRNANLKKEENRLKLALAAKTLDAIAAMLREVVADFHK